MVVEGGCCCCVCCYQEPDVNNAAVALQDADLSDFGCYSDHPVGGMGMGILVAACIYPGWWHNMSNYISIFQKPHWLGHCKCYIVDVLSGGSCSLASHKFGIWLGVP